MTIDAPTLKARICRPVGLALSFSASSRHLVVTRVEPSFTWNDGRAPGEDIAPGDLVLTVNGVEGTDGMMAVLRNAAVLVFDIEFSKSTGAEACDHPELREDLRRTLPGYDVSWSEVTVAVLQCSQAGGLLTKALEYFFELKLLHTGMLELTDPAPKPKSAKHRKEFQRVSALVASVGRREVLRRQGLADRVLEPPVQGELWTYAPVNGKAITARGLPKLELNGNRTGKKLSPGDTFRVTEKRKVGEVTFLRLSGGEGWVFDTMPGVGLMCTKAAAPAPVEAELWTYTPVNGRAITARELPTLELSGNRTGKKLSPGDTFRVTEKRKVGEVTFLRLSGGEGWVFDTMPGVGLMCTPGEVSFVGAVGDGELSEASTQEGSHGKGEPGAAGVAGRELLAL